MKKNSYIGIHGFHRDTDTEIVRDNADLQIVALAAGQNVDLMEKQIREFSPRIAGMWSEEAAKDLRERVADLPVTVVSGMDGLLEIASEPESDIVVTAVVGMIASDPLSRPSKAARPLRLPTRKRWSLPASDHASGGRKGRVHSAGGQRTFCHFSISAGQRRQRSASDFADGFRRAVSRMSRADLERMTLEDALKHPNWSMGKKVTIDSASLVNKGLEVMEARWLFDVPLERIRWWIHPQSILHSAVEYEDGAVIGQMGLPDMKLPIQYALCIRKGGDAHAADGPVRDRTADL